MSFGSFLEGFGGGLNAGHAGKMREKELDILEQMASLPPQRAVSVPRDGGTRLDMESDPPRSFGRDTPNVDASLVSGIYETAEELGVDPLDMATYISYETAGTFDPTQPGPTTQHGQHRGLIQWGEPQAREYGVDWSDPVGSQLGRDGAIVRYFRGRGWEPGMSGLDGYSIINAGRPGLYNRSDADNGGMPGTVRDKWEGADMAAHRAKAERVLALYRPERRVTNGGAELAARYYR